MAYGTSGASKICASTSTVKAKRGRPKKKPGYDRAKITDELLVKAVESFGMPYDDRKERPEDAPTIVLVANILQMTPLKVRKMLITAGYYSTAMSRKVQALRDEGYSIQEIVEKTGLKKASVNAYLPYTKGVYNLGRPTLYAEQGRRFRARQIASETLREHLDAEDAEMYLWQTIEAFANYPFVTESGQSIKYTVNGCKIFFNRDEKSVTKTTVMRAFQKARQLQSEKGGISGHKGLENLDEYYLFPIFLRIGICTKRAGTD